MRPTDPHYPHFQDHVTSSVNAIKTIKDDKKAGVIESK